MTLDELKCELYCQLLMLEQPSDNEIQIMYYLVFEPAIQERLKKAMGKPA